MYVVAIPVTVQYAGQAPVVANILKYIRYTDMVPMVFGIYLHVGHYNGACAPNFLAEKFDQRAYVAKRGLRYVEGL